MLRSGMNLEQLAIIRHNHQIFKETSDDFDC